MERPAFSWLVVPVLLLLAGLDSALAQTQQMYAAVDGSLSLRPPEAISGPITSILWKYNGNLVAELLQGSLDYYGTFAGRTTLDSKTGSLKITKMTEADNALYTVGINNVDQAGGYNVKVVKKLSKPVIVLRTLTCTRESRECTVSCGEDVTGAEPVTYSWKMGDGEWKKSEKDLTITNNEEIQRVKDFTCRMKNPVSEEESEPYDNLFFQDEKSSSGNGWVAGVIIPILVVVAAVGGGYWKRQAIKNCFNKHIGGSGASSGENGQQSAPDENNANTPLNENQKAPSTG